MSFGTGYNEFGGMRAGVQFGIGYRPPVSLAPLTPDLEGTTTTTEPGDLGSTWNPPSNTETTTGFSPLVYNATNLPPGYRWTLNNVEEYSYVKNLVGYYYGLDVNSFRDRLDSVARLWRWHHPEYNRDASGAELINWHLTKQMLAHVASGRAILPPIYRVVESPGVTVDYQTGEPLSEAQYGYYMNGLFGEELIPPGSALHRAMSFGIHGGARQLDPDNLRQDWTVAVPEYTLEDLALQTAEARRFFGGGGGGGGGAQYAVDERMVRQRIKDLWRAYLRQDPPDDEKLAARAARFAREAVAFAHSGGSLNLDAWITEEILQKTKRWRNMYEGLPDGLDELDWLSRFDQEAARVRAPERIINKEIVKSMKAGAGALGFGERIARQRETEVQNSGALSQRLAETLRSTVAGTG